MANEQTRVFVPDPPPAGVDPVLAEWLLRQFSRLNNTTTVVETAQKEQDDLGEDLRTDLDAHIQNTGNPHETLTPWAVDETTFDYYPGTAPGGDAGIGTIEKPVAHVAFGTQEEVGTSGIEGAIVDNPAGGGGLRVIGVRDVDPQNPPDPLVENSPVTVHGSPVIVGNQLFLEIGQETTQDHEVLFGPTQTHEGRIYAPFILGPVKVYGQAQEASDAADHDVLDVGEVEIVSMTLTDPYVLGASVSFQVYLENLGNKTTDFIVILKLNGVEAKRYPRSLNNTGATIQDAFPASTPGSAGDVFSLDVEANSTAPQSLGWVRGTIQPTIIRIQQG